MRFLSGHFALLTLLGIGPALAAPQSLPEHGEGSDVFTSAARPRFSNLDPQPDTLAEPGHRYGIGYDARHGIDTDGRRQDGRSHPDNRMDRGMRSGARGGPSGGAGRGGRGR